MKSPGNRIFLYASVMSALSLFSLWFRLVLEVPKVWMLLQDAHVDVAETNAYVRPLAVLWHGYDYFWPLCFCLIAIACLGFSPLRWGAVRPLARYFSVGASLVLLACAMALSIVIFAGMQEVYSAQYRRLLVFTRTLETFSIREGAENRLNQMEAQLKALAVMPREIKSAKEFSTQEQSHRVAQLVGILKSAKSPEMQKRILATALLLREAAARDERGEREIVAAARTLTGQSFTRSAEFFDWLAPRLNTDGWEPVPLIRFDTTSQK